MVWPSPFEKLSQHFFGAINRANALGQNAGNGNWGGFVIGVVIGIVWAPCAGPILATIATLAATAQVNSAIILVTIVYIIGVGIPLCSESSYGKGKIHT